jgi:DNA invertase Pin-like site-specific DNA recombinase
LTKGTINEHNAGMKNIALYCRVSTRKQTNENQLDELRAFAGKQDGWQIVAEYVDTVSGSGKQERKRFDEMLLAASQKKFDLLVFWKLDRFSREGVRQTLRYLELLDSYGVAWRSYMEPFFDSCGIMRDVVISIMATLASQERISISERTIAGLRRARKAGSLLGRPRAKVDMVKVEKRRAKGESLRAIAADLGVSPALLCKRAHA